MKIAYIRRCFPKPSETFIAEEIAALKKLGHEIRVFAQKGEFVKLSGKVHENQLLDLVVHDNLAPCKFAEKQNIRQKITSWWRNFRLGKPYFKNHFTHRSLLRELQGCSISPNTVATTIRKLFQTFVLSLRIGNFSVAMNQVILKHRTFRPDIIHCPFSFGWDTLMIAQLAKQYPNVPYTVTFRAREFYTTIEDKAFRAYRAAILEKASARIAISKVNQELLATSYPFIKNPPVVHSSIDPNFFFPTYRSPKAECFQIVSVARLVRKKGLKYLIEACSILRREGLDFHCRIIGEGILSKELREQISRLSLKDYVCLEGPYTPIKIREILGHTDVFVLPCIIDVTGDRDMLPNSLKEAMAMQCAVITSNISGIEELIQNGENGILVPANDSAEIANAISNLMEDQALRTSIGISARRKIVSDFNIEIEANKLAEVLKGVVAAKSPRRPRAMVNPNSPDLQTIH